MSPGSAAPAGVASAGPVGVCLPARRHRANGVRAAREPAVPVARRRPLSRLLPADAGGAAVVPGVETRPGGSCSARSRHRSGGARRVGRGDVSRARPDGDVGRKQCPADRVLGRVSGRRHGAAGRAGVTAPARLGAVGTGCSAVPRGPSGALRRRRSDLRLRHLALELPGGDPLDTFWMVAIALFAVAGAAQRPVTGQSRSLRPGGESACCRTWRSRSPSASCSSPTVTKPSFPNS